MRSMKQILTALAFGFAAMLAAPFASAQNYYQSNDRYYDDHYASQSYDGRYDDRGYSRSYEGRRYDDRYQRRSRNNALGVALAIGATALILSHDNHGYRGYGGHRGYRSHYRGHRGHGYRHGGYRRHGRGW